MNLILIMIKCSPLRNLLFNEVPVEPSESSKPIESPPKVRRSARSNKGIPPTRYGSITSHKVSATKKLGTWLSSMSKKIDMLYDHVFD